ncbi:MAG: hypothetical protein SWY16_19915 [Cyanobacteriota bacterium]|nr:hypothetical protein [Cyanobacteriota bacterium]
MANLHFNPLKGRLATTIGVWIADLALCTGLVADLTGLRLLEVERVGIFLLHHG